MDGNKDGSLFFVDMDRGKLICVETIKETDADKVRRHVQKVMTMVGDERTDELSVYEGIVPEGQRKICLAHWRKSKCRRAWQLYRQLKAEGFRFESENMLQLLELLKQEPRPPTLPGKLERLVRRYVNCRRGTHWKANQLLQHIERTWECVGRGPGDPTNNATERVIGLTYKIRATTMHGFKS